MDINVAKASSPRLDTGPVNITFDFKLKEPCMIGDLYIRINKFRKFYRDRAKSLDYARISTLKKEMDIALAFVRSYSVHAPVISLVVLMHGPIGRFLLYYCPYSIRTRYQ